jgi:hypothetical protein
MVNKREKEMEMSDVFKAVAGVSAGLLILFGLIFFLAWGCPQYGVYHQRLEGEAELAKAEYSKKVAVQEAQAKMDSAKMLANAEVLRAEGVAKANAIIGESLKGNEAYLRYLWISRLEDGAGKEVIYVPTEAGLPVLEAGKR